MRCSARIRRALRKIALLWRRGRLHASNGPQRKCPPTLTDLPPELICLIITYVSDVWKDVKLPSLSQLAQSSPRDTSSPLVNLSMVNRRMHTICEPALFRFLSVYPAGPLPPASALQHTRTMEVHTPRSPAGWEISEDIVRQMRQLSHVYWHGQGDKRTPSDHLRIFLSSPTLHSLTLSNVWLSADGPDFRSLTVSLRSLRLDFPRQVQSGMRANRTLVADHLDCFHAVLDILRPSLESLTLSGYSAKFSSLAAAPWPSLRIFTLTRGDAVLDVPWVTLLREMPRLSSLAVALDRRKPPLVLFPEPPPVDSNPMSRLREFTLSFPQPDDHVFPSLPSDIQKLSLRDTPRYYTFRQHHLELSDNEVALTSSAVLRIFDVLSVAQLQALELVYVEDQEEPAMRDRLARSWPNLTFLELHRYPLETHRDDAWYDGDLIDPVAAVAEWLAAFKSLRVLKLNFCFTGDQTERFQGTRPVDYFDRLAVFLEAHAQTIVRSVPWVKMLSLLAWSGAACGMHWNTWSVHPGDAADPPRLVLEDIYHRSFDGCCEWDFV